MADKKLFQGSGGGGPTTTPDSLLSEDIVEFALAVSEGPIRGLTKGAFSFYVGDTPLVSESGERNFEKFAIGVHPGYPEGSAKALDLKLGGVSSNFAVGVQLIKNTAVTRQTESQLRNRINQLELRLQIARLLRADDDGSTFTNTARFTVEYRQASSPTWLSVGGVAPEVVDPIEFKGGLGIDESYTPAPSGEISVRGKTTSGYSHEIKWDVPLVNDDWVIRVTKLSPDNDPKDVVDVSWESYQATSREKMTFPDTAIVHGIGVANGQFSSIPDLGGVYDGLIIRVPTNYNPDTRTYDETTPWNGSFKFAWTNNPAWILYDMIMNDRYGLKKHRRYLDANRFSFYQAAKWCDQHVPIYGTDKTRPRFTFNMQLNEPRPGLEMLNYVAGSFNGLVWDDMQGQVHLRVDKDEPAVMMFTPENIIEEGFQYTFTDLSARANDISVAFINPELDWNEDRRRIPNVTTNEEHIEKYGRIPMDFIAVGCTDVNEAIAKAQIRLISALTETTTVSFQTMRQGALLELYDIILVADPDMGWSQSGRLTTYDDNWLNFRDSIYIETMEDYIVRLQTVEGVVEVTVRPEHIGHVNRLKLLSALPAYVPRYAPFTIEGTSSSFGYAKPFRVLSISEAEGNPYAYEITAVEINRNKYTQVEGAPTNLEEFDYSTKFPYLPGQPTNFAAASGDDHIIVMPTGEVIARIHATWRKPFNNLVKGYILQYRLAKDGDTAWETLETTNTDIYISPVVAGETYKLRVASVDGNNKKSDWATLDHLAQGKKKIPNAVQTLTATGEVFQIKVKWNYGTGTAPDLKKVEVWSGTSTLAQATKMTDLAYPATEWVHLGLGINVTLKYWVRVQDSFGNYSPWTGPATATTVKDPSIILDQLEGAIDETGFVDKLKDRINLIDGPDTLANSVSARLAAEATARGNAFITERKERNDAIAAETTQRTLQFSQYDKGIRAFIEGYSYSRADADSSEVELYNNLTAQYKAYSDAKVVSYSYSKAQADSAISGAVQQVTARLNNLGGTTIEEAITSTASAITGLNSQYSVKVDSGGRVVGFGLSSTVPVTGNPQSIFAVVADNFALAYPTIGDDRVEYPFMVGQINGQSVVGINGALVIDGSLTVKEADIENASVGSLKIKGEAVMIPIVSNIPEVPKAKGKGKGEGIWTVAHEAYIQLDQACILYILHTGSLAFIQNQRYWSFSVRVNGAEVRSIMGRQPESAPVLSASVPLPVGIHRVEIYFSAHPDVYMGYSEIFMMGVKK